MVDSGIEALQSSINLEDFPPLVVTQVAKGGAATIGRVGAMVDAGAAMVAGTMVPGDVTQLNQALIRGLKQWSNAFVGNFLGKSPPLGIFQRTASRLWGKEGSVTIRFLAPSVYMINFPSQRVRDWVLETGPWHIQQKAIVLRRWKLGLLLEELKLTSTPIWIKLWHVPLELYSQQGLSYVASAVGRPLYSDRATTLKQHLEFAKCGKVVCDVAVAELGIGAQERDGGSLNDVVDSVFVCDELLVEGVVEHIGIVCDKVDLVSLLEDRVTRENGAQSLSVCVESPNKFAALSVANEEVSNSLCGIQVVEPELGSHKRGRIAAGGVVELMQQLKPKAKEPKVKKKGACFRVVQKYDIEVFCLLETRVREYNASDVLCVVYASNNRDDRVALWNILIEFKGRVGDSPWAIAGDFNIIFRLEESSDFNGSQGHVSARNKANTIRVLIDDQGKKLETFEGISGELIKFFSYSLGQADPDVVEVPGELLKDILGVGLTEEMCEALIAPVLGKEIKDIRFAMNGNKAPGPDGLRNIILVSVLDPCLSDT
ncbi:hypothetical protein V6N13_105928 [Hibiscus sabdariffa]